MFAPTAGVMATWSLDVIDVLESLADPVFPSPQRNQALMKGLDGTAAPPRSLVSYDGSRPPCWF